MKLQELELDELELSKDIFDINERLREIGIEEDILRDESELDDINERLYLDMLKW